VHDIGDAVEDGDDIGDAVEDGYIVEEMTIGAAAGASNCTDGGQ